MEMQNFAKIDFLLNITAPETTRKRKRTLSNRALLDLMVRERSKQNRQDLDRIWKKTDMGWFMHIYWENKQTESLDFVKES